MCRFFKHPSILAVDQVRSSLTDCIVDLMTTPSWVAIGSLHWGSQDVIMREMWESTVKVCLSMCENHGRQWRWPIFRLLLPPSITARFVNQLTYSSTIGIESTWEKSAVYFDSSSFSPTWAPFSWLSLQPTLEDVYEELNLETHCSQV